MEHHDIDQQTETTERNTERGASLVEYALLLALIVIVCVGAVGALGGTTGEPYSSLGSTLAG